MLCCVGSEVAGTSNGLETAADGLDMDDPGLDDLAERLAAEALSRAGGASNGASARTSVSDSSALAARQDGAPNRTEMQTLQVTLYALTALTCFLTVLC